MPESELRMPAEVRRSLVAFSLVISPACLLARDQRVQDVATVSLGDGVEDV